MSLRFARPLPGEQALPPLRGEGPFDGEKLRSWAGRRFFLPPGDPRLKNIHDGGSAPSPPLDNLVGAVRYWEEHPDWMAFLHPDSPSHTDKMVERALYLSRWESHLPQGLRVLDLGGGVGRFTTWLLDRGCQVELVDPDLRSLWQAVSSAAGRAGALDVHWTTGELLPDLPPFDVVIAAEVLCYVEDPARVIQGVRKLLRPGGLFLMSVEARYGWALSSDVYEGTIDAFLSDGVVHVPGDRWVRTYTEDSVKACLSEMEVLEIVPSHYAYSGPFENAAGPLGVEQALALEIRLREHAIGRNLNRAWMAIAREPGRMVS